VANTDKYFTELKSLLALMPEPLYLLRDSESALLLLGVMRSSSDDDRRRNISRTYQFFRGPLLSSIFQLRRSPASYEAGDEEYYV
jgi:hypothetical protein